MRRATCLMARRESGAQARMSASQRSTSALSSARGTTALTRPKRRASAAEIRRPVSSMPMAWREEIWRCRSTMPPSSGRRPTRASGRPNVASSAAMMRSHPKAISRPPPSAWPLTRAMTGTSSVVRSAMPPKPPGRGAAQYSRPLAPPPFISAPAEKARSPAPVSTTARMPPSASMRVQTALSSRSAPASMALSTSGRSMVTRATWPATAK